jgi:hypothetical protein
MDRYSDEPIELDQENIGNDTADESQEQPFQ